MKYLWLFLLFPVLGVGQQVEGIIFEIDANGEEQGVFGANVYWMDESEGTVTDEQGAFSLKYRKRYTKLVVSYVGYRTDTIEVPGPGTIRHRLMEDNSLSEVVIGTRRKSSATSFIAAQNIVNVSSDELLKAACCNLSESFETNPSIDVNFSDAVSGTRQIEMLGLTSPYILIATENVPSIRGAAQAFGLSFIPGTWVESIQIGKGAGSVINGFESITGQINAELRKPTTDKPLFVNGYGSVNGRLELNTHLNTAVNNKWSTGLYLHGDTRQQRFDRNDDGFLDVPLAQQYNIMNRWQYTDTENGVVSFINLRYLNDEKQTGELDFRPSQHKFTSLFWGSEIDTERLDVSAKLGYVNPELTYRSLGVQVAYSYHDQNSYFGLRPFAMTHNSLYATAMYSSILGDSRHKFKSGLSFTYDGYQEQVDEQDYARIENSVGGYFEYNYDNLGDLNLTAGVRIDNHNRLGTFLTPRLHLRYTPWEKSAFRLSAGRGKRSANIFTENQRFFASSREIQVFGNEGPVYGLDPEIAWNYGVSYLQGFDLFGRRADITFDFYLTDFVNQVVVDWEDPDAIRFYNLEGRSYAANFQVELNYEPFDRFDIRTAYKYYDVQTDYIDGRRQKPLTPRHRFFANAAYETLRTARGRQWRFDITYNWLGEQRFPDTSSNEPGFRLDEFSPTVGTLNAQITRVFSPRFEFYLGGENMTNVQQPNPILDAENPFGNNFDATLVYGPIFGSMYYAGFRFNLE